MREILFRGKRKDNGEWVYGSLLIQSGEWISKDEQAPTEYRILGCRGENYLVDPKTVGQYTGMTDKNGKKIFAGDIISTSSKLIGAVEWNDTFAKYIVCYNQISGNWFDFEGEDCFSVALDCVIIGNIHDNPELLNK